MNIALLSLTELHEGIRQRKISPVDLTTSYLERCRQYGPRQHAFTEVWEEQALHQAALSEQRLALGLPPRPLEGIPLALKDLVDVEGYATLAGSTATERHAASQTATMALRLQEAGAIVLGKTHLVELAFGGWGTNQGMGTPLNPWDQTQPRIAGGSSSGSAVAVASGMVAAAIGTDTGGSVRIPSAFCGLTGLKTTQGRVSKHGIAPLSNTLDTVGPMAWSAEDAAHVLQAMHGPDELAPDTLAVPREDFLTGLHQSVQGLRFAPLHSPLWSATASAASRKVEEFCHALQALGCLQKPFDTQHIDLRADQQSSGTIIAFEGYQHYGALLENTPIAGDTAARARILRGASITASEYTQALAERLTQMPKFHRVFDSIDFLVLPTVAIGAPRCDAIDESDPTPSLLTRFVGYYGLCAIALPCGFDESGLPLSVQLVAAPYQEALLLRLGAAYQRQTDHHKQRPAMR
jgi:aspartyl-tRNA(Asn)/glutamyl-tRNA(Gln) amidotransferase subunit A